MVTEELQLALPDRYRVKREIGRGGMAVVYLAEDIPQWGSPLVTTVYPNEGYFTIPTTAPIL